MTDLIKIESIGELHQLLEYDKPKHPLITLIDVSKLEALQNYKNIKFQLGFYVITRKSGVECSLKYGRQSYDFSEGSLIFSAPGQVQTIEGFSNDDNTEGWALCFHPDLISGTSIVDDIRHYSFFSYSANEALHLSEREEATIRSVVETLETEFSMNLDVYSHKLLVSNIGVLLNYCERFYGRQFITRKKVNKDVVASLEIILDKRFDSDTVEEEGIPSVMEIANEMGYSTYYLSDLLKKETGRTVQEEIHDRIISRAKDLLVGSDKRIAEIAYSLGYEYPEYFSKFFKNKVGMSPNQYRKSLKIS